MKAEIYEIVKYILMITYIIYCLGKLQIFSIFIFYLNKKVAIISGRIQP